MRGDLASDWRTHTNKHTHTHLQERSLVAAAWLWTDGTANGPGNQVELAGHLGQRAKLRTDGAEPVHPADGQAS